MKLRNTEQRRSSVGSSVEQRRGQPLKYKIRVGGLAVVSWFIVTCLAVLC
jgi:hypothetical protein